MKSHPSNQVSYENHLHCPSPTILVYYDDRQSKAQEAHSEGNRGIGRSGHHEPWRWQEGLADRTEIEKSGHAKYECPHCKVIAPGFKSMQIHHDARHPKIPFEESKIVNRHASLEADSSKIRPGVRGCLEK